MKNKLFHYLNSIRSDITWLKGDSKENCSWDITLQNQQEIIDLIAKFNEDTYEIVEIPQYVTPRQFRMALVRSGITLSQVDNLLISLEEPLKSEAIIYWEYATSFDRDNELLNTLAPLINITSGDLDNIFILANTL